jgi:hypothetical protein
MRQHKHMLVNPLSNRSYPHAKTRPPLVTPQVCSLSTCETTPHWCGRHYHFEEADDCVSAGQFCSANPGCLPHTCSKEGPAKQCHGGTAFCDHASAHLHVSNQVSSGVGETPQSKLVFEWFAGASGVNIKSCHADDHPHQSKEFLDDLETVMHWSRAMMMHQLLHWPDKCSDHLWPFAVKHAVCLWNNVSALRPCSPTAQAFHWCEATQQSVGMSPCLGMPCTRPRPKATRWEDSAQMEQAISLWHASWSIP